jgi:hypothetical protein
MLQAIFMTSSEYKLTHEEILERFRRLSGRDMTPDERRWFSLPESPEEGTNQPKPQQAATGSAR